MKEFGRKAWALAGAWWKENGEFCKAAVSRAVRTVAQTAGAMCGVGTVMSDVDWVRIGSASALAGILSLLTSISTGLPEVSSDGK